MSDTEKDAPDFIRRLINAWDCCGTCAGGVLAQRDRERDARMAVQPTSATDATDALWGDGGLFDQISRLVAEAERRGRAEALRLVRRVETDMADTAAKAWRSADARRGCSDHEALLVHADALTRWSERFRMAFDGEYYRADEVTP